MSPNSKQIACVSGKYIILVDVIDILKMSKKVILSSKKDIIEISFLKNNLLLASSTIDKISFWCLNKNNLSLYGKVTQEVKSTFQINTIVFSNKDNNYFACTDSSKQLKLWKLDNFNTTKSVIVFKKETCIKNSNLINCVCFSYNDNYILCGEIDGIVTIRKLNEFTEDYDKVYFFRVVSKDYKITQLCLSYDNLILLIMCKKDSDLDNPSVTLWNIVLDEFQFYRFQSLLHYEESNYVCFNHDNSRILSFCKSMIKVYNVDKEIKDGYMHSNSI